MASTTTKTSIFQKPSFFPSIPTKDSLPISDPKDPSPQGLRKRLSSFSLRLQPLSSGSTSWAFRRSKSMPAIGEFAGNSVKKWWDWGWGWILSRKPTFARDLELNEEETTMLGFQNKGSWKHIFYKVRSELRKLVGSNQLPTTQRFRYDSFDYAQNFDNGKMSEG
ncbi:uncharacterized protein LOC143845489 [Tasmannia lanceolata]|uniref:uncharacterized protein LOC143845489 n=1 Tax=Tasmannia lanceolata TaxID=3420 RepID=UPI0040630AE9